MTLSEIATLLTMCAAYDQRTIGDGDVHAWHAAIGDLDLTDAKTAVTQHYRASRDRIMPADVAARVKAIREDRIMRQPIPAPPPDARDYSGRLKALIGSVAAGQEIPRAVTADGTRPESTRADRPPEVAAAMTVTCPWCKARPRRNCTVPGTHRTVSKPHPSRIQAACEHRWRDSAVTEGRVCDICGATETRVTA